MSRLPLEGSRILFVGGKGGVGKTTTAAALGLGAAERGQRVLLVSTDPAHSLGDIFGVSVGDRRVELAPGLTGLEMDSDAEVDRYLERVKGTMRDFVRPAMYAEIERQVELTRQSPGAVEAALMEGMARLMAEAEGGDAYDRVIFDTAPTGHTLRLLALPEIMAAWTEGLLRSRERSDSMGKALERLTGKRGEGDDLSWFQASNDAPADPRARKIREVLMERRRLFSRARRILLDSELTAFLLVLVPEKLPVLESQKALDALRRHKVPVAGLVVNRVLPPEPLGDFLESRRAQEEAYLDRIDRLFPDLPKLRVPLLRRDVEGMDGLRKVAGHLGAGG